MKLFLLTACIMAVAMAVYAEETIEDLVLHGDKSLTKADVEQCYQSANLEKDELITSAEIKDGSFKRAENRIQAMKNGCFTLCIYRKRGLIVGDEIQREKLYAKDGHTGLNPALRKKIRQAVDRCVDKANTKKHMCYKSLSLITCIWKNFI